MVKERKRLFLAVLACFVVIGWLAYRWATPSFVRPPLPVPNGYDDLLQVAEMLAPRTGFYDEMHPEELTAVVTQNEPALALAREALTKECMVPLDWSADAKYMDQAYLDKLQSLRSLARAFADQAKQAAEQGDIDLLIQCGIDNLHLGHAKANGGLFVDWLTGQAIGSMGVQILREQTDQFSFEQCQQVQEALKEFEPYLEPPSQALQRERAYYRHTNNRWVAVYTQFLFRAQTQQTELQSIKTEKEHSFARDLLRTHVAVRQYLLTEKRLPEKLGDLVPKYLSREPVDPFTGAELVYQLDNGSYLIYGFAADCEEKSDSPR